MKPLPLSRAWLILGAGISLGAAGIWWNRPEWADAHTFGDHRAMGRPPEQVVAHSHSRDATDSQSRVPEPLVPLARHTVGSAANQSISDDPPSGPRRPAPLPRVTKPVSASVGFAEFPPSARSMTALATTRVPLEGAATSPAIDKATLPAPSPHPPTDLAPVVVPFSILAPSEPATIPAALAAELANTPFTETEQAEVARLTDAFFRDLTGSIEDPTDSDYRQQWQQAQEESDARMRASLGGQAWLLRHREVHREALQGHRDD